jgi:hypothetical protein
MRKRYYLSFDMEDPRHQEAERLFTQQASRHRTEFVVSSILSAKQNSHIEKIVRRAVREEINQFLLRVPPPQEEQNVAAQLEELPGSLIHAFEDL